MKLYTPIRRFRGSLTGLLAAVLILLSMPVAATPLDDANTILAAVAPALGGNGTAPLDAAMADELAALDPLYWNFAVAGQAVERYQKGEFSGSIILENALRRRAIIAVEATYDGEGEGLKVTSVSARTVVPLLLTVDTFLVPTAKAENVLDAPTLTEMFIRMAEVVVPIGQVDAFGGDYTIFAAVRERLDPGANLWLGVSATPDGPGDNLVTVRGFDFEGWRVVTSRTWMTVNAGPTSYIKLIYKSGPEAPEELQVPRLVHAETNKVPGADSLAVQAVKQRLPSPEVINVRDTPSTEGLKVGQLEAGSDVGVVAVSPDNQWAYVTQNGRALGYVFAPLLGLQDTAAPAPAAAPQGLAERLRELEELHDADLITQYDYEVKRQEILDSL